MKTRVITALIGAPILIAIMYLGSYYRIAFFLLLAFLALRELFIMMQDKGLTPMILPGYIILLLSLSLYRSMPNQEMLYFLGILLVVIISVIAYPRIDFASTGISIFFAGYCGFLLSYALKISLMESGFMLIMLTFLLTWASDIGGYFAGSRWGKHKMAPLLSPKKTWEGAAGGILMSVIIALLFYQFFFTSSFPLLFVLLGVLASAGAQFGDLFISGLKRYMGAKDSGNLIPGHGGVLDRFDSFILVVPIVYYFVIYAI